MVPPEFYLPKGCEDKVGYAFRHTTLSILSDANSTDKRDTFKRQTGFLVTKRFVADSRSRQHMYKIMLNHTLLTQAQKQYFTNRHRIMLNHALLTLANKKQTTDHRQKAHDFLHHGCGQD